MSGALKGLIGKVLTWTFSGRRPGDPDARPNSPATLQRAARRVVVTQGVLTAMAAAGFGVAGGVSGAAAAAYGGGIAMLISGWQGWRLQRLGRRGARGAGADLAALYVGVVQRYAAVFVLLGVGLAIIELSPLPLVVAFALAQLGYWVRV